MMSYIRAELYKVIHRKYTWITLGVTLLLETLLAAGWAYTNVNGNRVDFYAGTGTLLMMLGTGFYAGVIICDMVFASQYKHSTLKNEVSFGIPRSRIYLGKLAVEWIVSMLFMIVMLGYYLGLCYFALYRDPELDIVDIQMVGYCLATALPLWTGVLACTNAFYFLVKSDLGAALISLCVFEAGAVINLVAMLLSGDPLGKGLETIYNYMPGVMLGRAPEIVEDWAFCGQAWIVGAIWLVGFSALGILGFRKKEIK